MRGGRGRTVMDIISTDIMWTLWKQVKVNITYNLHVQYLYSILFGDLGNRHGLCKIIM